MIRTNVNPRLIRWARERAGRSQDELARKFAKLPDWEAGRLSPTLKQVKSFADSVHVPVGYLFLDNPPEEPVPIPDFRTVAGRMVPRPSPDLLDTIYACQERQSWYREYTRIAGESVLGFVGCESTATPPVQAATRMRDTLDFSVADRRQCPTWSDAMRLFARKADEAGVLVMVNGVVNSNNYRRLDPDEFRGFALADPFAPLVFVNGADSKAAQMFTLAHELAHIWLGQSALTDVGAEPARFDRHEEIWCNAVAAEFLMPIEAVNGELQSGEALSSAKSRLARTFKVSTLVVLRRLLDSGWLDRPTFDAAWTEELKTLTAIQSKSSGGGNFHRTTLSRVGRRFARALFASTLEGQTLYRDAYRMLGVRKAETFQNLGHEIGIEV